MSWRAGKIEPDVRLFADGLGFKVDTATIRDLSTDIRLVGLDPIVTEPAQTISFEVQRGTLGFFPVEATFQALSSGLFVLDFDDDRYLPFEGAGAISSWRIEMSQKNNWIDMGALRDLVLTLRYRAEEGGGALRERAREALGVALSEPRALSLIVSLRNQHPETWEAFMKNGKLEFKLGDDLFDRTLAEPCAVE